jgi:hypothetical protein
MNLLALALAMWAVHHRSPAYHLDANGAISQAMVFLHLKFRQIQWNHYPSVRSYLFCITSGMLIGQGLLLLFLVFLFLPGSTKNKPFPFFSSLFSSDKLIHPLKGRRAECERENTASARVMQKCGMTYEGTVYDDNG